MFDFSKLVKATSESGKMLTRAIKRHDRLVMTIGGGAGIILTAVLSAKGAVKAHDAIAEAEVNEFNRRVNAGMEPSEAQKDLLTTKERVSIALPCYGPAIASGVATEACVIGSYTRSEAVIANLAGVAKLYSDELAARKVKTEEIAGHKKAELIDGAVAKEEVLANPPVKGKNVFGAPGAGKTLMKDHYTGQYVWSSRDRIERLCVSLNNRLSHGIESSFDYNEYLVPAGYDQAGLARDFGFNEDHQLYPEFDAVSLDDNERDRFGCDTMLVVTFGCGEFNRDGGPCYNYDSDWPSD